MKSSFHKKIYPLKAVKAAVEAFSEVATITVGKEGDYITVELDSGNPAEDAEFMGEFENFVLGETTMLRGVK